MMPWEGGLALSGSPDIRHPSALQLAEDIVYDHAGAKLRRGGQVHLHRVPIREGTVLEDHFLALTLDSARWPVTSISANHHLSSFRRSVLHASQVSGTTGGTTTISNVTKGDTFPDNKMKYLVNTLSSDEREKENQATTISIQWRMRGSGPLGTTVQYGWPDYSVGSPTENYVGIEVEAGRPGGSDRPEWHLDLRFGQGLMLARNASGTMAAVSFLSTFDDDEMLRGGDFHTWRADITRNTDTGASPPVRRYLCDLYCEEVQVASTIEIDNDSAAGTAFAQLTFDTTGASNLDFEIDSFDVQAEVQEVRGLFEFSEDPTDIEGATRKRAIYAGSRIYLDVGNHFDIPCIDDGLDKDQFCSFEVFESRIRPFRIDRLVSQQTS
jgi:hypothetical protein